MAQRERVRKQVEAKKLSQLNDKGSKTGARKLKNNDSALLLQELQKKKKRGEDLDDQEQIDEVRKSKNEK